MIINILEIKNILRRHLQGDASCGIETLHTRSGDRGSLHRLSLSVGGSIVVKVWRTRNIKEQFKSSVYLSNGRREWQIHRLIHKAGVHVPKPLFFQSLTIPSYGPCEIMAIEDFGETECGVPYLKRLIATGRDSEITVFEDRVIDITSELLRLRILDVDNQLNNFLIDVTGRVIRIDFECARKRRFLSLHRVEYATMLDRLLRSHLHATYSESERTTQFMAKVASKLSIPFKIRQLVTKITRNELQRENKETGFKYASVIDW